MREVFINLADFEISRYDSVLGSHVSWHDVRDNV